MLGISVYLQDLDVDYLAYAAQQGVQSIFCSLHIPEEKDELITQKLPILLQKVKEYGMELIPDISPTTFAKLGIELGDYQKLAELGIVQVRLDYGFDDVASVKQLMAYFTIILNASTITESYLQSLQLNGIAVDQMTVMHNFYPREHTGLSGDDFRNQNELFLRYNMKIQAFVCGDTLKRFPLYDGLPTLEHHRNLPPIVSAIELEQIYNMTDIFIGDSQASKNTLGAIQSYLQHRVISVPVYLYPEYEFLYDQLQESRSDAAANVIRLGCKRQADIPPFNTVERLKGYITQDNALYGRYSGEVQIMKAKLPRDSRVNVIGFIHPDFTDIVAYIKPTYQLCFKKLNFYQK